MDYRTTSWALDSSDSMLWTHLDPDASPNFSGPRRYLSASEEDSDDMPEVPGGLGRSKTVSTSHSRRQTTSSRSRRQEDDYETRMERSRTQTHHHQSSEQILHDPHTGDSRHESGSILPGSAAEVFAMATGMILGSPAQADYPRHEASYPGDTRPPPLPASMQREVIDGYSSASAYQAATSPLAAGTAYHASHEAVRYHGVDSRHRQNNTPPSAFHQQQSALFSSMNALSIGASGDAINKRLGWGFRPVLLVLDPIRGMMDSCMPFMMGTSTPLLDPHRHVAGTGEMANQAARNCAVLVGSAREARCPIIWSKLEFHSSGPDYVDSGLWKDKLGGRAIERLAPSFEQAALPRNEQQEPGGWLVEHGLVPRKSELCISRQNPSAFFGTSLVSTLRAMRTDCLVICGFTTSFSVRSTAIDSMSHGYKAMIVAEACADRFPEFHNANLVDIHSFFGDVVGLDDANHKLRRGWGAIM